MTSSEFDERLKKIRDQANEQIVALVILARNENADGNDGSKRVDFIDDPNWQRTADSFAELCGWIYDRLDGRTWSNRKVTKKIRKALGYSYP